MKNIKQEAARWFARMRDAGDSPAMARRFAEWQAQNPAHAQAYAAVERLWIGLDAKPELEALAGVLQQKREEADQERRNLIKRATLGLAVGGFGAFGLWEWRRYPVWEVAATTDIGRLHTQVLQDGSQITLGARSRSEVTFTRAERCVNLISGEAAFDVKGDERRAFSIDAGLAQITARGARLVVSRFARLVRISVQRGQVEVASGGFWQRQRLAVEAGEVAEVGGLGGMLAVPQKVRRDPEDAFAFTEGKLVFSRATLEELAETLSRYSRQPVRVSERAQAVPPISALVHSSDIEGFLKILPRIVPVTVTRREGQIWLGAAQNS